MPHKAIHDRCMNTDPRAAASCSLPAVPTTTQCLLRWAKVPMTQLLRSCAQQQPQGSQIPSTQLHLPTNSSTAILNSLRLPLNWRDVTSFISSKHTRKTVGEALLHRSQFANATRSERLPSEGVRYQNVLTAPLPSPTYAFLRYNPAINMSTCATHSTEMLAVAHLLLESQHAPQSDTR